MTTTALMPLDPSVSPQQATRVLPIRANLLPPEIRDSRRSRHIRAFVLSALVLVLIGLGGWYVTASNGRSDAEAEYNQTLEQLATVQRQQQKDERVQRMVTVKKDKTLLKKELEKLLATDMSWRNLIDLVRDTGTGKVTINEINVALVNPDPADAGNTDIGTLRISGAAKSKKDVAEYVEALGRLSYVSDPFVNSVTEAEAETDADKKVEYALTVSVTDEGLCGRFSAKTCESRGK